ncbi:hypothetical protein BC629DRAFT_1579316 [Irpex lacteus]|nr:hypothetical protein BC629DRAFT_1579316 [Irpex lacteus]
MKFFSTVVAVAALVGLAAAESHTVTLINNCGAGTPVFLYQGHATPRGSGTISGQLLGGIAWLSNYKSDNCLSSGVNCGAVEFTLRNDAPNQNAADFTLEAASAEGHHLFTYPMAFQYTGACTKSAKCASASNCPGAFTNPTNGAPVQCLASDVGIRITFC